MSLPLLRTARRLRGSILIACGSLILGTASLPVPAQTSEPGVWSVESNDWTGTPQPPDVARKEAAAALAEGRRECARERERSVRTACLERVRADHARMMKRIAAMSAKPGAQPPKPAP